MLDINLIRNDPQYVQNALGKRRYSVSFEELLGWDTQRRERIGQVEALKSQRNAISAQIPMMKKEGQDVAPVFEQMKQTGEDIRRMDEQVAALEGQIHSFLSSLPNLPDEDVQAGGKENNQTLHAWGERPAFDFNPRNHVDLAQELDLIDYERGAKLSGSGFWIYTRDGARLEWALLQYFIDQHLADGYEFLLVPHILNQACGYTAGQFPKFADEVFWLAGESGREQFILPTAETALVNVHRGEILDSEQMPRKYFAYTPCYRLEAGSYRAEERGMIRGHQFNKVEMVQYAAPEQSKQAFDEMVEKAERLVQGLGLHYRLSKLAAGDCSASMARTYDIEVWIPSMGIYKEVSSASNANDYQARRGNIKYRNKQTGRAEFVHTLNASGLATSRIMPALLEQHQQADGSVIIPSALQKWMGKDRIMPQP